MMEDSSIPELLYIMGRGHSGTTVLDVLLGNGTDIVAVGELVSGMDRYQRLCGCGQSIETCPFWSAVRNEYERISSSTWEHAVKLTKGQAHIKNLPRSLISFPIVWGELRRITINILTALSRVSGRTLIVDSSKEPTRALFLVKVLRNAKIIHLVRNPEQIIASTYFRIKDGTGFRFLRKNYYATWALPLFLAFGSFNWFIGNIIAEIITRLAPDRVLQIRYEDLCGQPKKTLFEISQFIERDMANVISTVTTGQKLHLHHKIAGNRLRMQDFFVFNPEMKSNRELPRIYRWMVKLITFPLRMKYDYV